MKLNRRSKNNRKFILKQVLDLIPPFILRNSVRKFKSDKGCHKYRPYDQLVALTLVSVQMIDWDHLKIPYVNPELCIGCGACEFACPTEPFKAIYVESNHTHLEALPIAHNEGPREEKLDDFPF